MAKVKAKSKNKAKAKVKAKVKSKTKAKTKVAAKPKMSAKVKAKAAKVGATKVKAAKIRTANKSKPMSKTKDTKSVTSSPIVANAKPMSATVLVGQKVPSWQAPATGNKTVSADSLKGRHVVLYFYPKDKTPGCTLEGHDFTRLHESFKAANAEVFGISRDNLKLHESFKECEGYSIDLLSDEKEELCGLFGVIKDKNMYGKQVRGIERSTFVLDAEGRLVKEWRGVKVDGHAQEVLEFVKSLG